MATKYALEDYALLQNHSFFVDANVLIYLFWPTGSVYWETRYARVFRRILKQGNKLFVDFLVISEVINRTLRIEHNKLNPSQKFKEFRDSLNGQETLSDIHTIVKESILNHFEVIGKTFTKQDVEDFLVVNQLDFMDKGTLSLCKENSLTLITNDRDFKNADLNILTGNPSILN